MNCQIWKSSKLLLSFTNQCVDIHLELPPLTPEESEENLEDDNGSKPPSSTPTNNKESESQGGDSNATGIWIDRNYRLIHGLTLYVT